MLTGGWLIPRLLMLMEPLLQRRKTALPSLVVLRELLLLLLARHGKEWLLWEGRRGAEVVVMPRRLLPLLLLVKGATSNIHGVGSVAFEMASVGDRVGVSEKGLVRL